MKAVNIHGGGEENDSTLGVTGVQSLQVRLERVTILTLTRIQIKYVQVGKHWPAWTAQVQTIRVVESFTCESESYAKPDTLRMLI